MAKDTEDIKSSFDAGDLLPTGLTDQELVDRDYGFLIRERESVLRKDQAETEQMELQNRKIAMEVKDLEASADENFSYPFYGDINEATAARCIQTMDMWSRRSPKAPITITFSSQGGSVVSGLAIYDFIKELQRRGHVVTTKALGMAASMACVLLQAGDDRVMTRHSLLMVHEGSAVLAGSKGEIADMQNLVTKLEKKASVILCERSNLTTTSLKRLMKRTDVWLDSDEAIKHGLVDRVEG